MTYRRSRHLSVVLLAASSLAFTLSCARDVASPVRQGGDATDVTVPLDAGNLVVGITYNGQDASAYGTDGCPFHVWAFRGTSLSNTFFCSPLTPTKTLTNLAPGIYDVSLRWPQGSNSNVFLGGPDPVTIVAATVTTKIFDVSHNTGIVTGVLSINGQPPNMSTLCLRAIASTTSSVCKQYFATPPAVPDGRFRFFVPAGAGKAQLKGQIGNVVKELDYVAEAGETVDLGAVAVDAGDLNVTMTYKGQSVNLFGAMPSPNFFVRFKKDGVTHESFPFADFGVVRHMMPGRYEVAVRWSYSAQLALGPVEQVDVPAGAITAKAVEISDKAGLVTARVTINGQSAQNVNVCLRPSVEPPGTIEPIFQSGNICLGPASLFGGRFKIFVPAGPGKAEVQSLTRAVLRKFEYVAIAGETVDLGTIAVDKGDLALTPIYKGADVATYGTDGCPFWASVQSVGGGSTTGQLLCPPDGSRVIPNLAPGNHNVRLLWSTSPSWPLTATTVVPVSAGAVTSRSLDLTNTVGIVSGIVTINGQPPVNVDLCLRIPDVDNWETAPSRAAICKIFPPTNGATGDDRFKFFVPPGCGRGQVRARTTLGLIGEFRYCAIAGQEVDVGDPLGNRAPVITSMGGPYSGAEGSAIQLSAAATDADGDALTYEWQFGDGASATGAIVGHAYKDNGSYSATLTVRDGKNAIATGTTSVIVTNVAPGVVLPASATIIQNETLSASGSFADPGMDSWTATVSYDGGAANMLLLSGKTFALLRRYTAAGSFTVVVTVTDDDGGAGVGTMAVRVWTFCEAIADVEQYVREHAGAQEQRPLLASLEAACAAIDRGNMTAAVNQLDAYLSKLAAFVRTGKVAGVDGAVLETKVRRILTAMSN